MPPRRGSRTDKPEEPKRPALLAVPRQEAEEKIRRQITEGEELQQRQRTWDEGSLRKLEHDVRTWRDYTNTLLKQLFTSTEYADEFSKFMGRVFYAGEPVPERWRKEQNQIAEYVRRLESIEKRLPLLKEDVSVPQITPSPDPETSRTVFVVHGHNDAVKQTVARFLEKLDLKPIILHEQANMGRTVIEKFEAHSSVGYAVVLLTPDDVGGLISAPPDKLKPRARQNVILELGYFIGKLGRGRVCALYMGDVELPSDIHGVLFVPYDASDSWQMKLARELKAAGIDVDLNRAL